MRNTVDLEVQAKLREALVVIIARSHPRGNLDNAIPEVLRFSRHREVLFGSARCRLDNLSRATRHKAFLSGTLFSLLAGYYVLPAFHGLPVRFSYFFFICGAFYTASRMVAGFGTSILNQQRCCCQLHERVFREILAIFARNVQV